MKDQVLEKRVIKSILRTASAKMAEETKTSQS
jgi:hypothetical protein